MTLLEALIAEREALTHRHWTTWQDTDSACARRRKELVDATRNRKATR